jgi:hypothetical protein
MKPSEKILGIRGEIHNPISALEKIIEYLDEQYEHSDKCKGCPDCLGIVDNHTKEFSGYASENPGNPGKNCHNTKGKEGQIQARCNICGDWCWVDEPKSPQIHIPSEIELAEYSAVNELCMTDREISELREYLVKNVVIK